MEMFDRLAEVLTCLDKLLQHQNDPRLVQLRDSLRQSLDTTRQDYTVLCQVAEWLQDIAELLSPQGKPDRTGDEVRRELWTYLDRVRDERCPSPRLQQFYATIRQYSLSYDSGLFHTYDLPDLPRTNNGRESEFRDLTRRLLSTTGQKGLTRRLIQRQGAWELIPHPTTLSDTIVALSHVDIKDLTEEQQRLRDHRSRFRLHTRSAKQSRAQLEQLVKRWYALPTTRGP